MHGLACSPSGASYGLGCRQPTALHQAVHRHWSVLVACGGVQEAGRANSG